MIAIDDKIHITVNQAAELVDYHPASIQRLAASGKIRAIKIGHVWAIGKESIIAHSKQRKRDTMPTMPTMTIRATLLGHKMRRTPSGRVICTICQELVSKIASGRLRCKS